MGDDDDRQFHKKKKVSSRGQGARQNPKECSSSDYSIVQKNIAYLIFLGHHPMTATAGVVKKSILSNISNHLNLGRPSYYHVQTITSTNAVPASAQRARTLLYPYMMPHPRIVCVLHLFRPFIIFPVCLPACPLCVSREKKRGVKLLLAALISAQKQKRIKGELHIFVGLGRHHFHFLSSLQMPLAKISYDLHVHLYTESPVQGTQLLSRCFVGMLQLKLLVLPCHSTIRR